MAAPPVPAGSVVQVLPKGSCRRGSPPLSPSAVLPSDQEGMGLEVLDLVDDLPELVSPAIVGGALHQRLDK